MSTLLIPSIGSSIDKIKANSKRIEVIDALRGFALMGIIIIHACSHYATFPAEYRNLNMFDSIINTAAGFLFRGRAFLIFSFLFGLSFAIQIQSAKSKNKPFIGRFIWRLTILLVIGYLHRLFYSAEILQIYAILGFALVLCAYVSNRWLLFLIALFYLVSIAVKFYNLGLPEAVTPIALAIKTSEFYNFTGLYKVVGQIQSGRAVITFTLFLLGLYAGRKNIFSDTPENRLFFKKALVWSIVAVVATTITYSLIKFSGTASEGLLKAIHNSTQITQAFFYVAAFVNLYRIGVFNSVLQWLVPMGRMGLTIYIMQSVFLVLFFGLGFGILSSLGLTLVVGITALFFLVQILFARWWMSYFLFGPVEWLWRALINFKWEPIRRKAISPVV